MEYDTKIEMIGYALMPIAMVGNATHALKKKVAPHNKKIVATAAVTTVAGAYLACGYRFSTAYANHHSSKSQSIN